MVEKDNNIKNLKCKCKRRYTWTKYCRKCPEYHYTHLGKSHSEATKQKQRIKAIEYIKQLSGQVCPRYNKSSILLIEKYGKKHGYNFKHAENGGEYHIRELGYFLDGYDKEKTVVIEIDEKHHFDPDGNLKKKDLDRQNQIENYLNCKFIRLKI